MPSIRWNKTTWDGDYDWSQNGDEWSSPWGTSGAMWFATIMPRIGFALPCDSVLEIAPGHGRCTKYLLRFTNRYTGVDLSARCVAFCRRRFGDREGADFLVNDGMSLAAIQQNSYSLVFSFDSLVHADLDAISAYVPQVVSLLRPGGVAFLHHSNLGAYPGAEWQHRSPEVSARNMLELVKSAGGRVLIQETFGGDGKVIPDCFTTFCRREDFEGHRLHEIAGSELFVVEGRLARERFVHYVSLEEQAGGAPSGRPAS